KSDLQVGDFIAVGQALDGFDRRTIGLNSQYQAGTDDVTVYPHCTGAADAVLATDMRSRQMQVLAQKVCEVEPCQNVRIDALAVDVKRNRHRCRHAALLLVLGPGQPSSADTQRSNSTLARWLRIEAVAC